MKAMERKPEESVAEDNNRDHKQIRLEFHVPAVASWMRYAGPDIFKHVPQKEVALHRWVLWEKRLRDIAEEESDNRI